MAPASLSTAKFRHGAPRRGLTLIELVIVASLLVLLAAIAIPTIQLAVEGRRVREAARALNVYLGAARNRAMATGRPVGVALRRFENEGNASFVLDQVESPPIYTGPWLDARVQVGRPAGPLQAQFLDADFAPAPLPEGTLRVGDRIRFNHQGYWYRIDGPDAGDGVVNDATVELNVSLAQWQADPWPTDGTWSVPMPYEIRRQPDVSAAAAFRASISKPLQLPLDAVIDLSWSGFSGIGPGTPPRGHFSLTNAGPGPVFILFSPNGGLDGVYYPNMPDVAPADNVFLLVGKRERIPRGLAEDGRSNLEDSECLWVTIRGQTGLVSTVENGHVTVDPLVDFDQQVPDLLLEARQFTGDTETMGGR